VLDLDPCQKQCSTSFKVKLLIKSIMKALG